MTVMKRNRGDSKTDLLKAIDEFTPLLADQKEQEAVEALNVAAGVLKDSEPGSEHEQTAVATIIDAFEGEEHELIAYCHKRENAGGEWTIAEQLYNASSRVLSLARRMKK